MITLSGLVSEEFQFVINLHIIKPHLNPTHQIVGQFRIVNCLVDNKNESIKMKVSPVLGQSYANASVIIWSLLETRPLGSYPMM
jgi:hypothetical protein